MSSDSLYFTASPSAAILDPMGWTQTSYMPGRLEDPASRLSALGGVAPSRLAPSVDAAGTWGLDTTGPDLSALYMGAVSTAAADPEAPPEPDPVWLGLPIEETGDAVSGVAQALADKADDLRPSAWVPDKISSVSQAVVFAVTGLKPNSDFKCTFYSNLQLGHITRTYRVRGDGKILLQEYTPGGFTGMSFTSSDGVRHFGRRLIVSGTGSTSTIRLLPIGNGTYDWQLGTTYSGYTINVPTATEVRQATAAYNWAVGTTKLPGLTRQMSLGDRGSLRLVEHYHRVAWWGHRLINNLGQLVNGGNRGSTTGIAPKVTGPTFWTALSRLASVLEFQNITKKIEAEANYVYRNPNNVLLPTSVMNTSNYTMATSVLGGFLKKAHFVVAYSGVRVEQSGVSSYYLFSASNFIRSQLVRLGHLAGITRADADVSAEAYRGNAKALVQRGVRKAADDAGIGFLTDGAGPEDAWDPVSQRVLPQRRELVEEHAYGVWRILRGYWVNQSRLDSQFFIDGDRRERVRNFVFNDGRLGPNDIRFDVDGRPIILERHYWWYLMGQLERYAIPEVLRRQVIADTNPTWQNTAMNRAIIVDRARDLEYPPPPDIRSGENLTAGEIWSRFMTVLITSLRGNFFYAERHLVGIIDRPHRLTGGDDPANALRMALENYYNDPIAFRGELRRFLGPDGLIVVIAREYNVNLNTLPLDEAMRAINMYLTMNIQTDDTFAADPWYVGVREIVEAQQANRNATDGDQAHQAQCVHLDLR